ncbi:MAG TPA: UTP--glucose-1-phosphate uridylyltransferase [Planctomycetota bacterium]|nr:UTP--glucose-1-phosphate uridylyltransferase [Planctomycetota bacterium]
MPDFTAEQLRFLHRYGFDELLFQSWRSRVRDGSLSRASNVVRGELRPPPPGAIRPLPDKNGNEYRDLVRLGEAAIARGEVGVVVLNGGMATRFGGVVKGIVDALPGRSFLALRAADVLRTQQRCGGRIDLFVMNSFATEAATKDHFAAHDNFGLAADQVHHFNQFVAARLTPEGEVFHDEGGHISPYATGHGDFAPALRASEVLQRFRARGGRVLFAANVDNLGARISPLLIGMHLQSGLPMTVEVAPKWPGDVGGSPFVLDGRLQLIEQIRYPEDFDADMVDVFNTNTFYFDAAALDRDFDLGWHYVEKKVGNARVVQIERLIGELTRHLDAQFVKVKRTGLDNRFLPVKTPEDLQAAREEIAELYAEPA